MDKEMIERCVAAARRKRAELISRPLDRCYEDIVLAVLKAMREPTEKMVAAVHGCYPDIPDKFAYPIAKQRWHKAIDTIIGDK